MVLLSDITAGYIMDEFAQQDARGTKFAQRILRRTPANEQFK